MQKTLTKIQNQALQNITQTKTIPELEQVKAHILGKKGELTELLKNIGALPKDDRPKAGQQINLVKQTLVEAVVEKQACLENEALAAKLHQSDIDITLPAKIQPLGKKHPINQTIDEIVELFRRIGFSVKRGPDVESEKYNFESLNIPAHHPSRDMHDTFYLKNGYVMRTHTSPVQIHVMENQAPPIKIICPGKVYRCDADVTHSPVFHQIEGLYVDTNVNFGHLKGTLEYFLHALFGTKKNIRVGPSSFQFTEQSAEVDVECVNC